MDILNKMDAFIVESVLPGFSSPSESCLDQNDRKYVLFMKNRALAGKFQPTGENPKAGGKSALVLESGTMNIVHIPSEKW